MEAVMEDVRENFADVRLMLARDAERLNIDLSKLPEDNDEDDFDAMTHPRSERAREWQKRVYTLAEQQGGSSFWRATEAAADLFWYANTFVVKTARDIDNVRALEKGDKMARVDFVYTRYVLTSIYSLLDNTLVILENAVQVHRKAFVELRADLTLMTEEMQALKVIFSPFSNSRE